MQILFIVLNKMEAFDEILEQFAKQGISGATILESKGMAQALYENSDTPPFLDSLWSLFEPSYPDNKTIFVVLKEEKIPIVSAIVNEATGGLENPDTGVIFSMPVHYAEGFHKKREPQE